MSDEPLSLAIVSFSSAARAKAMTSTEPTENTQPNTGELQDPYGGNGYKCGPHEDVMWIYNLDALKKATAPLSA